MSAFLMVAFFYLMIFGIGLYASRRQDDQKGFSGLENYKLTTMDSKQTLQFFLPRSWVPLISLSYALP